MEDDPQEKIEALWVLKITAVVKKLQTMPPINLENFIFESWDRAIIKIFRGLHPNFMKDWNSFSRGFKEEAILPGAFIDKSYVCFRKVVLDTLAVLLSARPPSQKGKA